MELEQILKCRNIAGEIYLSDVKNYFGIRDTKKAEELRDLLEKVSDMSERSDDGKQAEVSLDIVRARNEAFQDYLELSIVKSHSHKKYSNK